MCVGLAQKARQTVKMMWVNDKVSTHASSTRRGSVFRSQK